MDYYIVRIFSKGGIAPEIELCSERATGVDTELSLPYLDWILQSRQPSVQSFTLELSPECTDEPQCNILWNTFLFGSEAVNEDQAISSSYEHASNILLKLSDSFPAPGSFVLKIFWDMRGIKIAENLNDFSPILGALKKLCSWHQGHIKVYTEEYLSERFQSIITFMDEFAELQKVGNDFSSCEKLSDSKLWRGHLEILHKDASLQTLPGFSLSGQKKIAEPEVFVNYIPEDNHERRARENDSKYSCVTNNRGYVWMDPGITVISFVDITTVPLFYFSGKRWTVHYRINERYQEDLEVVKYIQNIASSSKGALLCCLHYAFSSSQFDEVQEYSSKNWEEAVLNTPDDLSAPKYKFPHKVNMLHLLLRHSDEDSMTTEYNGTEVIQFTAHVLHRAEELDFSLACKNDEILSQKVPGTSMPGSGSEPMPIELGSLTEINPAGLFHKESNFNRRLVAAVKIWIDENGSDRMPMTELQRLVNETIAQLDSEQESIILNVTDLPQTSECVIQHTLPEPETIFKWQLEALSNKEKILKALQGGSDDMKLGDGTTTGGASKSLIDMHIKPSDILKRFSSHADNMGAEVIKLGKPASNSKQPSPSKLRSFKEAIKMTYHGITYNVDEHAAEKHDRMCRRLVEHQVKFETCSIGSSEKVPSPATITVADSPVKSLRPSLLRNTGSAVSIQQKRMQLKKVADKIYEKRVRTKSALRPAPSTSMVLRSTPKKGDKEVIQLKTSTDCQNGRDSTKISIEERKRLRRRTYVQDNKKRLQDLVMQSLIDNGVAEESEEFKSYSKRLYNVSMAFLRDLKSSKDLDKIMKETVTSNIHSVISFKTK